MNWITSRSWRSFVNLFPVRSINIPLLAERTKPAETHLPESVGEKTAEIILVELKPNLRAELQAVVSLTSVLLCVVSATLASLR
jgi:hypothetical protein